jgi:hypothetical protein
MDDIVTTMIRGRPLAREYTITRLFVSDTLKDDRYTITLAGELVTIVAYDQARALVLGKIHPAELVQTGAAAAN